MARKAPSLPDPPIVGFDKYSDEVRRAWQRRGRGEITTVEMWRVWDSVTACRAADRAALLAASKPDPSAG
jgi:hypothetical protein